MNCPSCGAAMDAPTLEGHLGTQVQIDICAACQVIWFDHLESLRLSPGATLRLFKLIGERNQARPAAHPDVMKCPRCDLRLLLTNDRQRNTPFRYWRCGREHGRLITFFDFLREKDFIRPLSPQQLAELRQNVQTINCSNCGAPIDLVHASQCEHCGSPVSMLDLKQVTAMASQLQQAEQPTKQLDPADLTALFAMMRAERDRDRDATPGLVEAGLQMLVSWLT